MEFQRKWRKIDREFQRAAYNSKIQLTVSPGWFMDPVCVKLVSAALFEFPDRAHDSLVRKPSKPA